jgi:hypothetical protein
MVTGCGCTRAGPICKPNLTRGRSVNRWALPARARLGVDERFATKKKQMIGAISAGPETTPDPDTVKLAARELERNNVGVVAVAARSMRGPLFADCELGLL